MGKPELEVERAALEQFAVTSADRSGEFDRLRQKLLDANVGRMSFGLLPVSGELYQAYTEQVDSCLEGMQGSAEVMNDIAEGIRASKENYDGAELSSTIPNVGGGA